MTKLLALILFSALAAYSDEIEDAIVKDLDFYLNLEILENEEVAKNWKTVKDSNENLETDSNVGDKK